VTNSFLYSSNKCSYLLSEELCALKICLDDEQPVVVEVGDDGLVVGCEANAAGRVEVLPHGALEAVLVQEVAVGAEELDSVVPGVRHQDLVSAVASHVPGVVELAGLRTLFAEGEDEIAADGENLGRETKYLSPQLAYQQVTNTIRMFFQPLDNTSSESLRP